MMDLFFKWNKQQDLDDENQEATHNIEFLKKANTLYINGRQKALPRRHQWKKDLFHPGHG